MASHDTPPKLAEIVSNYASQCVKCALCLPHCPTYELTQDENESPRGRIELFHALANEKLPLTAKAKGHLDLCLGCRACERVCPADVEYGQLLTLGRALLNDLPPKNTIPKVHYTTQFLGWIATKPFLLRKLHWLLWVMEKLGLRKVAQILRLPSLLGLKSLDDHLPSVNKPISFLPYYTAIGQTRGKTMLFTGCMSTLCDQETLLASIYVLRYFGFDVVVPPKQNCCGAIAAHAGQRIKACCLAKQNNIAFLSSSPPYDYIITTATGCSAFLQEYEDQFSSDFAPFSAKVMDILSFIQQIEWPSEVNPQALPLNVMLHTPCTRRNVLKDTQDPELLLKKIPSLSLKTFQSPHCCGAAGTYMLDHPTLADPLASQLLAELKDKAINFLATSNIGCALHLQKQVRKAYPAIKIGHPITLLARSLGF